MEITNDLIQKFFENKCDPEEFEVVARYLGWEDWNTTGPVPDLPEKVRAEALEQLRQRLFSTAEPRPVRISFLRRMAFPAVAASLLLVVAGWLWVTHQVKERDGVRSAGLSANTTKPAIWIQKRNVSNKPLTFGLPDGSKVKLYANSSLRYTDSFGIVSRDIWIDGEGEFSVQRDKARRFTAYTRLLATTALGTAFGLKDGTVRLYSGRVVVRARGSLKGWNKDIYLLPGQQLSYDDHGCLATVSRFNTSVTNQDMPPASFIQQDLAFNNSSLKEVFRQLSIQYHTKITFRSRDLTGLNFTGVVPRTDSLGVFLKLLAGMNDLDIQEQPAGYTVARHHD